MFNAIKSLYDRGRIDADGVRKAFNDGLITEEQMNEILN